MLKTSSPSVHHEAPYPDTGRAWSFVAILFIATTLAYVDRQVLNLLVDPIRSDLGMSDTEIALIQGLSFALFYTLLGIPLGRLVDRLNRRNLIVAGVFLWSVATVLCGFAWDFWSLFAARSTVGIGEAILTPACVSLIADLFPPQRRGRAIATLGMAIGIGAGSSYLLGAAVLRQFSDGLSTGIPFIDGLKAWQATFIAAGVPGLVVCCLLMLVVEPARREMASSPADGRAKPVLRAYLKRNGKALLCVYGAGTCLAVMSYAAHSWSAPLLVRQYGMPASEVGFWLGVLVITGAILGGLLCGWSSDRLAAWRVGGRIWAYPLFLSLALPLAFVWPQMPNAYWALATFLLCNICYQAALLATPTMLQELAPNEIRGVVVAGYMTVMGVIGVGFGPLSVALVTDRVFQDSNMVWASIIIVTMIALTLSIIFALAGIGAYRKARAEAPG